MAERRTLSRQFRFSNCQLDLNETVKLLLIEALAGSTIVSDS